ncbi:hypothetical protein ABWL48_20305, partial [Streptococcus suis]
MVAGSMILMWLANMNTLKGIGGAIVIILTNMTTGLISNIVTYVTQTKWTWASIATQGAIFALVLYVLIMIAI